MIIIKSTQNEKIKEIKRLQSSKNFYWWEGTKFFAEILKLNVKVSFLIYSETFFATNTKLLNKINAENQLLVSDKVYESISCTVTPQGIGGLNKLPEIDFERLISLKRPCFYLAGVQDPGNVGTIVRIADAFNFGGVIYETRGASPYSEKAVRSSAGSILRVNCLAGDVKTINKFQRAGFSIFLLTPHCHNAKNIEKVEKNKLSKALFVLGQEGTGIDFEISGAEKVFLPMSGNAESLNVAVTAGIIGYLCNKEN